MPPRTSHPSILRTYLSITHASGFAVLSRALCLCTLLIAVHSSAHAQGVTPAAQYHRTIQDEKDVRVLPAGPTIERKLAGGESHYYRITLESHQYLRVRLVMNGINVVLTLLDPDGKKLEEVDTPESTYGEKSIMHMSESAGDYLLEVRAPDRNAAAGRYFIVNLRQLPATEQNMDFIIADRATTEGWRLHEIGTEEALRQAIGKFTEALPRWHAVGDRTEEVSTLMYLGEVHHNLSEYQEALEVYERALPLWRSLGNHIGEGWTFNNIGAIYMSLGKKQEALDSFLKSLRAYEQAPTQDTTKERGLGIAVTAMGGAYLSLGETPKALDYFNQALPHWRAANDTNGEARALFQIAEVHSSLGDHATALDNYLKALQFWRNTSDLLGEGRVLTSIGKLYTRSGEHLKALDYLGEALEVRRTSGDRRGQARTLTDFGVVYSSLGDHKKAVDYYAEALPLNRAVSDREGEANTLYQSARAQRDLGHLVQARDQIETALDLIEQVRTNIVDQELRASYFATVRDYYEFYIDLLMRQHQLDPAGGFDAVAIQASERARARSLIETLAAARVDIHEGVAPQLVEREGRLQRQLNGRADYQMRLQRSKHTEEQIAAITREINALTNEYQEVRAQILASNPRYAALSQPAALTLKQIQQEILDGDSLLLEYALGDERSFLWAVTPTSTRSIALPKRSEIEAAAARFYQLLTARNKRLKGETAEQRRKRLVEADAQYPEASLTLSHMLLGPVASQLGSKRLIIVTEGALQYVPFAALRLPLVTGQSSVPNGTTPETGLPLIVEHEIVTLPSASTLAVLRREMSGRLPAPKAVAVVADPVFTEDDLRVRQGRQKRRREAPTSSAAGTMEDVQRSAVEVGAVDATSHIPRLFFSRAEALGILSLVPQRDSRQALDFQASKATATSPQLGHYRIVHFATHALLNNAHPELSGIVLSLVDERAKPQDGFLRLHEIYNMKLPAELVVLSACQSGLGKEIKGEGMVGLTRGFMYAGSPRVVSSLWKIDDRATADLMKRFYAAMLGNRGLPPAAALRAAQIEMWKNTNWSSPYYWAAFMVQGEWH